MVRTTPHWHPVSPRTGMRTGLREVLAPGGPLNAGPSFAAVHAAGLDGTEPAFPPLERLATPHRLLYGRPDLTSASSEHGRDVPSTTKARARRLAALIGQMHTSRPHGDNAPLSRLATAN